MELLWRSDQGTHNYYVWKYKFSTVLSYYKHIQCRLRRLQGRAVVCTHRQRWWWVVMLSRLWLTADTHTQTLTHNHSTTNSDHLLSHMYTKLILYTHSSAHTGPHIHTDNYVKLCQQQWKCGARFQDAQHPFPPILNVLNLIDFERRAEPTFLFSSSANDTIFSTLNQLW